MDQLAATIGAACTEAMRGIQNELNDLKTSHHAAIDLFSSKFGELRRQLSEQDKLVKALEKENAGLKEAQQVQQSRLNQGHDESLRKELEQVKQASHFTKSSLQNQFGTLQATQSQQLGRIEELSRKTADIEQLRESGRRQTNYHMKDYSDLKGHVTSQAQQLESLRSENATMLLAHSEQDKTIKRLETAVHDCNNKLAQHDYTEALTNVRNFLGHLQKVQQDHVRMIEVFATEQDELKHALKQQETQNRDLRDDLDGLKRCLGEHEGGSDAYERYRAAPTQDWKEQVALMNGHEVALSSLERNIADLSTRLGKTEARTDELRKELLTVTQTTLEVIKQMRSRESEYEQHDEERNTRP